MEKSNTKNIALWVLQVLLAIFYVMQAVPKLMGDAEVIANFGRWGFPEGFHLFIGALELLGGIGLLIPRTAAYAAGGLIAIMLGAAVTHILSGDGLMVLMPIVPMLLLAIIAYMRSPWASKQRVVAAERR